MKIVLTGASGFLGRHLLPRLAAAGHECLVFTRYAPGCKELKLNRGVTLRQADVFDDGVLTESLQGAGAVINMVGILNEKGRSGKGFHRAHVELVEKLIGACNEAGVRRLLHVSAVGAGEGTSHYLRSKGEAEERIRSARDLDWTVFRPSVIFGDGDAFFNRFAALLRSAPFLPLACPGARMQPVWAGDVAAAMSAALDDPATAGRVLITVGPETYTLRELVALTASMAGLQRRIVGLPDGLARMQARIMDFVPGKPFSSDNYLSLQTPNTSAVNHLPELGIEPTPVAALVPGYLGPSQRQRRLDDCRRRMGG